MNKKQIIRSLDDIQYSIEHLNSIVDILIGNNNECHEHGTCICTNDRQKLERAFDTLREYVIEKMQSEQC